MAEFADFGFGACAGGCEVIAVFWEAGTVGQGVFEGYLACGCGVCEDEVGGEEGGEGGCPG